MITIFLFYQIELKGLLPQYPPGWLTCTEAENKSTFHNKMCFKHTPIGHNTLMNANKIIQTNLNDSNCILHLITKQGEVLISRMRQCALKASFPEGPQLPQGQATGSYGCKGRSPKLWAVSYIQGLKVGQQRPKLPEENPAPEATYVLEDKPLDPRKLPVDRVTGDINRITVLTCTIMDIIIGKWRNDRVKARIRMCKYLCLYPFFSSQNYKNEKENNFNVHRMSTIFWCQLKTDP